MSVCVGATNTISASFPDPATTELVGLSKSELVQAMKELGLSVFRSDQIWHWLYVFGAKDIDEMTNISKPVRQELRQRYSIYRPQISRHQRSVDGTQKWLLRLEDGNEIEMVHIPEPNRGTLCVSSQVGCILNCKFCFTGTQRLVRNLQAKEIIGQLMLARDTFGEWPASPTKRHISNIVFMGMGEPLYNYEEVSKAIKFLTDPNGLAISKRKITLSTAGVVPIMRQCGEELGVNLAVSLHAVNNEIRNQTVPLNTILEI